MAFILINVLYFNINDSFSDYYYFIPLITIVLLPLLAYPIQSKFKLIKGDKRKSERKLAIIFSMAGYIIGLFLSIILNTSSIDKIVFSTYLLSASLITFFTFIIKVNASGHMCGVTGPIAIIVYVFGPYYLLLSNILIIVIWSSLYLKRHNIVELLIGSIIPILSLVISIIIFK